MRLLFADEHVPVAIISELVERGASVLTLTELGLKDLGIEDREVLEIATSYQSTVITFNRKDYLKLHRQGISHGGIILCKYNTPFPMLIDKVYRLLDTEEYFDNQVFRIVQD